MTRFFQKTPEQYEADSACFFAESDMNTALGLESDRLLIDLGLAADRLAQEALEVDSLHMASAFDQVITRAKERRAAYLRERLEAKGFQLVTRSGNWWLKGERAKLTTEVETWAREWREMIAA